VRKDVISRRRSQAPFTAEAFLQTFCANFLFHATTAYDILRSRLRSQARLPGK